MKRRILGSPVPRGRALGFVEPWWATSRDSISPGGAFSISALHALKVPLAACTDGIQFLVPSVKVRAAARKLTSGGSEESKTRTKRLSALTTHSVQRPLFPAIMLIDARRAASS